MGTARRVVINTLERSSSADINRSQQFQATLLGELARSLFDDLRWPMSYPGLVKRSTATATPLRGHVLSGLMVQPDNAAYLTVSAGELLACVTPAGADETIIQHVIDPGVVATGTLTFTANATSDVRLDIVECSIVDTIVEQTTVPIFNESAEQFVPTPNTPKVREPRLSYRVRVGVAGAGLPAMQSGWLPLAVVNVRPGAAGFSTCDIWDVRPLLADRDFNSELHLQPNASASRYVRSRVRGVAGLQGSQAGLESGYRGHIGASFNGYRAGGELRSSVAIASGFGGDDYDSDFMLNGSEMEAGEWSPSNNQPWFHAAIFPGGLPRWVRYSQDPDPVAGARVPRGPRGIVVKTTLQPNAAGFYTAITLPVACGFTGTHPGVALAAGMVNASGSPLGYALRENVTTHPVVTSFVGGKTGSGSPTITWTFSTSNSGYPANATALILDLFCGTSADGTVAITVEHKSGIVIFSQTFECRTGGDTYRRVRIPLWTGEVDGADTGSTIMKATHSSGNLTASAIIAGWEVD